jgi:L-alanine-DL-glutamate epimerase-like enolase superfamily enzyme
MKIAKVECEFLHIPLTIPVRETPFEYGVALVTLTTEDGVRGTGFIREHDFQAQSARQSVLNDIAPLLKQLSGPNLVPGYFWHEASFAMPRDYRAHVGVVTRAMSAIDQALWDIYGQETGQPVFRLLGGSQPEIDLYVTYGLNIYTEEEEMEAARRLLAEGFAAFKIQGLDADRGRDFAHDARRVQKLREAVGPDARIILDGRNNYSLYQAIELANAIRPYNVAFFDEPLYGKDPVALQRFKEACPWMMVAGRTRGGNIYDARDLIASGGVNLMGVNVLDQGGFTQGIKVAHMAQAYQLPVVTGGAWYMQNAHLIAAATNGWMTEYHGLATAATRAIFDGAILHDNGKLRLTDRPGLGLTIKDDAVRDAQDRAKVAAKKRD